MNSRKAAKTIPSTVSRLLKSRAFLKQPPPSFYPLLSHPPPPSLVRFLPQRPVSDLPPSVLKPTSPYRAAKLKAERGSSDLSSEEALLLRNGPQRSSWTRRKPPRQSNTNNGRPLEIVYAEDEIRRQFFRDHPFEAYRPQSLAEGETVQDEPEPRGKAWTELRQRSIVPTSEDAIAYVLALHTHHNVPLSQAYNHSLSQFRTLRAEHEMATRSAALEARAHGAVFFGEVERGLAVEERVLDTWVNAREVQDRIAAGGRGGAAVVNAAASAAATAASANASASAVPVEGMWATMRQHGAGSHVPEDVQGEIEFTGGLSYLERFAHRGQPSGATEGSDMEDVETEARP